MVAALAAVLLLAPQTAAPRLKLRVAVVPLDYTDARVLDNWQIPVEFRNALDEKLVKRLLDTGRFVVLEREALEAILTEKAIQEENTGQSKKGRITPAQAIVRPKLTNFELSNKGGGLGVNIGGIGRVGGSVSEAKGTINVRIFEVDSTRMIASEEASGTAQAKGFKFDGNSRVAFADFAAFEKSPLGQAMDKAITQAVEKIVKVMAKEPWSARVADVDGSDVILNAGEDSGLKAGDTLVIYRRGKEIRDPDTGEILGARETKAGTIRITDVQKKLAVAQVVDGTGFQVGDVVKEK